MPWPSFVGGHSTLDHGWYAAKRWDPVPMRLHARPPEWLTPSAFWDSLDPVKYRIAWLDVPFSPHPDARFIGICLQAWQNHDQINRYSRPAALWHEFLARFEDPIIKRELCTSQSLAEFVQIKTDVLAANDQFGRICSHVLRQ